MVLTTKETYIAFAITFFGIETGSYLSQIHNHHCLNIISEGGFRRRVKLEVGLPARGDVWCSGVGPSDGFFVLSSLSQMVQAGGALSTGFELSGCKRVWSLSSQCRDAFFDRLGPLLFLAGIALFGDTTSLAQKIPCGFSVVGAREEVRSWSCQPRLSFLVAARMEQDVCNELFFDESDHKEQIIGEAKITGFCLS
ncbi:hypothetical protein F2Q68_00032249 [Brassica cretica]|uniref:Uncharacterized protein n=1 Tax=Brassica cretica TaxID=69181 RepID=A0A8S9GDB6_BRACR|nr:hypothetical protein F2Q68_00032249 [Brassica cretica]